MKHETETTQINQQALSREGPWPWYKLDFAFAKRVLTLGLPVILGMLTQTAVNWVDTAMIGRLDGEAAVLGQAALGPSLILLWAFGGSLSAIQVGTQALVGRRIGEEKPTGAGQVLFNSLGIAAVTSAAMALFAVLLTPAIFVHLIGGSEPFIRTGIDFCQIRFIGVFSMVMMMAYKAFFDGLGHVWVHVFSALAMNIINAVLDYGLIFGKLGLPELGITGAAWASVISSFIGLLLIAAWSFRPHIQRTYQIYRPSNFSPKLAFQISALSFWAGMATIFVMSGFGIFYWIVGQIDASSATQSNVSKATFTVVVNAAMLCFMASLAFGSAPHTLLAQSIGEGRYDRAKRYAGESIKLIFFIMGLLSLVCLIAPEAIVSIFLPSDGGAEGTRQAVIAASSSSIRLVGLWIPFAGAGLVYTQILYGAGESRYVMLVEMILHFACLAPLSWLLAIHFDMGLHGCWIAAGTYATLLFILMRIRFRAGAWQHQNL